MRVLIDEDTAVQLLEPLQHLLPRHTVNHVGMIRSKGKKDRSVLNDARKGIYAFITRERNQFSDPAECAAIKK